MARIKLLPFNNVVGTGLATLDLSNLMGWCVERISLNLGGTAFTKAMMTGIQIKANGKIIYDTTGSRRDAAMQYRGITSNANFLTLDMSEIRSKTELGQSLGSLDTSAGILSLKMEVQITGATAPTLQGYAEVSRPQVDAGAAPYRTLIGKVHGSTVSIAGAGTYSITVPHMDPTGGQGSIFKRILFFSANMTGLVIKKNGVVVEESTKALNDYNGAEYRKVPQTGLYVADFIVDDNQSQVFNSRDAQTIEVLATFSGAETITIESEVLEPVGAY